MLRRFWRDRRGASEIVGTALFLVILFFFFSNVFLWHDQVTREMDQVFADRMNSGIKVVAEVVDGLPELHIQNVGGLDVILSRLWIINSTWSVDSGADHVFANFEPYGIHVAAGSWKRLLLEGEGYVNSFVDIDGDGDGDEVGVSDDGELTVVHYAPPSMETVRFRVLTKRANSAADSLP